MPLPVQTTQDAEFLVEALLHSLSAGDRSLTLIIGSGLSRQADTGVWGVREIVQKGIALHPHVDRDGQLQQALLSNATDIGDLYRIFMRGLAMTRDRGTCDDLVRQAVLGAWTGDSQPTGDGLGENDLGSWRLTDALLAVGEIVAHASDRITRIITTNFDPLIEVAIRRAGTKTRGRVVTADAGATANVDGDGLEVVYVHGFWYQTPMMHTEEQLTTNRPRLQAGVRRALTSSDVLVIGYGGWDDVITGALEEVALDDGATAEIRWAFYEADPALLRMRNRALFARVDRLLVEGMFHPYTGIDCHMLLPEVAQHLVQPRRPAVGATAPAGWLEVDERFLDTAAAMSDDTDLVRFFDGRHPDWAVVADRRVPMLNTARGMRARLRTLTAGERSDWQLLLATAGDGKSTCLMQVATEAVRLGWRVLVRSHPGIPVDPDALAALPQDGLTLLVIDDADTCVPELEHLAQLLATTRNIHLVACARLVDWRAASGDIVTIQEYCPVREVPQSDFSIVDARAVAAAWEAVPHALGKLSELQDLDDRAQTLKDAVDGDRSQKGSLLGGLFRMRFDVEALDSHVDRLLDAVAELDIPSASHVDLLRAFLYIAITDVANVGGLDRRVWADLLGVEVSSLRRTAEFRLGREAATARAGMAIQVRHIEIARSAVRLMRRRAAPGLSVAELMPHVMRSTIDLGRDMPLTHYSQLVHASTRLVESLQLLGYSKPEAVDAAVATAKMCVATAPEVLVFRTNLGAILRRANRLAEAADHYLRSYDLAREYKPAEPMRVGFHRDWALTELALGNAANAILVCLLSLGRGGIPVQRRDRGALLMILARAFALWNAEGDRSRAPLALGAILRIARIEHVPQEDISACEAIAADGGAPPALADVDRAMAIKVLSAAVKQAVAEAPYQDVVGRGFIEGVAALAT